VSRKILKIFFGKLLDDKRGIPLFSAEASKNPKRNGPSSGIISPRGAKF
jgi:hypothetical protein